MEVTQSQLLLMHSTINFKSPINSVVRLALCPLQMSTVTCSAVFVSESYNSLLFDALVCTVLSAYLRVAPVAMSQNCFLTLGCASKHQPLLIRFRQEIDAITFSATNETHALAT